MARQTSGNTKGVRVIVVSPTRVVCDALHGALAQEKSVRVLKQLGSVNGIAALSKRDPNVIVVCDGSSIEALRFIAAASRRLARTRLVVFGNHSTRTFLRNCADVRIKGLVSRNATLKELVHAIKSVHEHGSFVSQALQSHSVDGGGKISAATTSGGDQQIARPLYHFSVFGPPSSYCVEPETFPHAASSRSPYWARIPYRLY